MSICSFYIHYVQMKLINYEFDFSIFSIQIKYCAVEMYDQSWRKSSNFN